MGLTTIAFQIQNKYEILTCDLVEQHKIFQYPHFVYKK